ncbi:hypothetical protein [Kutzneria sp. CA-103260]|uniref:hypothetical protein n=1 Tax=Kutzneria sp. CA-103260 TaxID=2802641 RepID=UPI001BAD0A44|nr:hypothetical protein [Kutzneria sp. CA-103260]
MLVVISASPKIRARQRDRDGQTAGRVGELLEVSDLQVEQIAVTCGLGSGTTPTAYRRTFSRG